MSKNHANAPCDPVPCGRYSRMSMLAERAPEVGERYFIELHHTRRQLGWLAQLRTTVGLVATEQNEYCRLVAREEDLLRLVGLGQPRSIS
jgi:hypothetical protein